ncbi:unnamed protein product [Closterium sp. Naga37s-1]|nr:unnamed protein product [Closterium sp. Naga37s-1]
MKSGRGGSGAKKPGVSAAADGRGQRSIASFFGGKDQSGTAGKALPGGGQRSISSFFGAKGKAAAVGGGGGGGKSEVEGSNPSAVDKASEELKETALKKKEPLESAAAAADSPVPTQTAKGAVENGDGAVASAGKEDSRAEQAVAEEAWGEEMADAEAVGGREGGGGSAGGGAGEAVTGGAGARRLKRLRKVGEGARGAGKGREEGAGEGEEIVAVGGGTGEVGEGAKKARHETGSIGVEGGDKGKESAAAAAAATVAAAASAAAAKASASAVAAAAAAAGKGASTPAVTPKSPPGARGRKKAADTASKAADTASKAATDAPAAAAVATAELAAEGGKKKSTRRRTSSRSSSSSSSDSSGSSGSKGAALSASSSSTSDGADVDSDMDSASSDLAEPPVDAAAGAEEAKSAFDALKQAKGRTETKAKRKNRGKGAGAGGAGGGGAGDGLVALAAKLVQYDPVAAATWKSGERVPFLYLAQALDRISNESGRLAITEIMCNVFRTVMATSPDDLLPIVYLAANRVAPPHEGVELGIGDATIIRALAEATGRKEAVVKSEYKECGDLGLVAKASRTMQRMMMQPAPLTCHKVFEAFRFIAKESGSQSVEKKRARIKQLLVSARQQEPQFIVRLLQGKMRIGLAEQTVLAALAQAAVMHEDFREGTGVAAGDAAAAAAGAAGAGGGGAGGDDKDGGNKEGGDGAAAAVGRGGDGGTEGEVEEKWPGKESQGGKVLSKREKLARLPGRLEEAVRIMKHAYSVLPVYDQVVPSLLRDGIWAVPEACQFTLGVPVGPMLAKPTRGISEILDKLQGLTFTCEYKYDGERTQVHGLADGTVQIYSRNAECTTGKFPDLVQAVQKHKKSHVQTFVLDAEAVAYDRESDKILPFQVLSTRARKGVIMSDIKVQVCMFAFDLLYLNGQQLLTEKLVRRRELLLESFEPAKGEFQFATAITTSKEEELQAFFDDAVNHSCEGAMVKTLDVDATYEPAKRSNNWLKLKKDYMEGLGDSLDLVPIGAFHGRGKRTGVFGAFLLACYDPDTEEYQSICKTTFRSRSLV